MRNKIVTFITKNLIIFLIAIAITSVFFHAETVHAETEIPDEVFLTEVQSGTCTLASTAMLIRGRMYLSGSNDWTEITDTSIRGTAWAGSGLYYNFTIYPGQDEYITVGHEDLGGISADYLKALLDEHKEGIVLYCGSLPHAVYVTDYEGDEFYCADPKYDFDGKNMRINIKDSLVGQNFSTLEGILSDAIGYWYIREYSVYSDVPQNNTILPMISDEEIREVK